MEGTWFNRLIIKTAEIGLFVCNPKKLPFSSNGLPARVDRLLDSEWPYDAIRLLDETHAKEASRLCSLIRSIIMAPHMLTK